MKQFFIVIGAIFIAHHLNSCSSEFEDNTNNAEAGMTVLKSEILSMACDYGVNVRLNENVLKKNIKKISLDNIEKIFMQASSCKGNYAISTDNENGHQLSSKKQISRKRRISGKPEQTFVEEKENGRIRLYCSVSFLYNVSGELTGADSSCSAIDNECVSTESVDNTSTILDMYGIARITGEVQLNYYVDPQESPDGSNNEEEDEPYMTLTYSIDGACTPEGGSVSWR